MRLKLLALEHGNFTEILISQVFRKQIIGVIIQIYEWIEAKSISNKVMEKILLGIALRFGLLFGCSGEVLLIRFR